MRFNPYDYDETCVMHCASRKEAAEFAKCLKEFGLYDRYPRYALFVAGNGWSKNGGGTCYRFHAHKIDSLENYRRGFTVYNFNPLILEFGDFNWGDEYISLSFDEVFNEMLKGDNHDGKH